MKRSNFICCLLFLLVSVQSQSQKLPCRVVEFKPVGEPTQEDLGKHDLSWIKTCNRFDQSRINADAIDAEIENIIKKYDLETSIVTFDVPINMKRLVKPDGKKLFSAFDPAYRLDKLRDQPLNEEVYFWKYRDIDIAVGGDAYLDQYLVYSTARALEILRCRYPKAYQKLFVESRSFPQQAPTLGSFVNRFNRILISFQNVTKAPVAESGTVLVANEDLSGPYGKYSNLAVVSFHQDNLLGKTAFGSSVLYNKSADENFIRYLKEGIVETLVHEMLHRFIETRRKVDELATIVTDARDESLSLNLLWDEIFINNTSLHFFLREGGVQPPILLYYKGVLDGNIAAVHGLRLARIPDDASKLKGLGGSNYTETMRFNYLD